MVVLFLVFWGTSSLFSIAVVFQFLHILTNTFQFYFKYWSAYWVWDNILLWFWFAFPWWLAMLSIFSYAYRPCLSSLEKCLFESFAHFLIVIFTLLVECRSSLPINLLPGMWFANIFYFCLFTVDSSAAQKFWVECTPSCLV